MKIKVITTNDKKFNINIPNCIACYLMEKHANVDIDFKLMINEIKKSNLNEPFIKVDSKDGTKVKIYF